MWSGSLSSNSFSRRLYSQGRKNQALSPSGADGNTTDWLEYRQTNRWDGEFVWSPSGVHQDGLKLWSHCFFSLLRQSYRYTPAHREYVMYTHMATSHKRAGCASFGQSAGYSSISHYAIGNQLRRSCWRLRIYVYINVASLSCDVIFVITTWYWPLWLGETGVNRPTLQW